MIGKYHSGERGSPMNYTHLFLQQNKRNLLVFEFYEMGPTKELQLLTRELI